MHRFLYRLKNAVVLELLIVKNVWWKLKFFDLWWFQSRNKSMKKLLRTALKDCKNFDYVVINTWDQPINRFNKVNVFSFSVAEWFYDKLIPDFIFDSWKECWIVDYEEVTKEIKQSWEKEWLENRIWWIWNFKTSKSRIKLADLWDKYPKYFDIKDSSNPNTKWLSLWELVKKYVCLIDVEGRWYSWRTKLLFFSWRPLFIQERRRIDYCLNQAIPREHYIPIRNDFGDLKEKFEEYLKNPEKYKKIWKNWQKFAENMLSRESALHEIENQFNGLTFCSNNTIYIRLFIINRVSSKIINIFYLIIRKIWKRMSK